MSLRKDVINIQLTAVLNILAGLIYFPILARFFLFPPETFGQYQYLNSIMTIIMSFALFSLDLAFISDQKKQDRESTNVAFSTMLILGVISFGLGTLGLIVLRAFQLLELENGFIVYVFFAGVFLVMERVFYALFREKGEFTDVAKARVIITISHPITGCFLAIFFRNSYVLLVAFAFSHLLGALYYYRIAKIKGFLPHLIFKIHEMAKFFRQNLNVVVFQTPSALVRTTYGNLPVLLIRKVFNSDMLGFYAISMRVLGTANRLLSQGLYETFLPYAAKSATNRETTLKYLPIICATFFPVFLGASFLSIWYVPLLFGDAFLFVSDIIKIMAPFYFTQALVGPYIGFILIYRRSELDLAINLVGVFLSPGLFFLGNFLFGFHGAVFAICISGIIVEQSLLLTATHLSGKSFWNVCGVLFPYQAMLLGVSFNIVPFWISPILLIPSFFVVMKNRNLIFRKQKKINNNE